MENGKKWKDDSGLKADNSLKSCYFTLTNPFDLPLQIFPLMAGLNHQTICCYSGWNPHFIDISALDNRHSNAFTERFTPAGLHFHFLSASLLVLDSDVLFSLHFLWNFRCLLPFRVLSISQCWPESRVSDCIAVFLIIALSHLNHGSFIQRQSISALANAFKETVEVTGSGDAFKSNLGFQILRKYLTDQIHGFQEHRKHGIEFIEICDCKLQCRLFHPSHNEGKTSEYRMKNVKQVVWN
jgi:hypothetical protein